MKVQCLSCGGTYDPIQADGSHYYHRCALAKTVTIGAGVDSRVIDLADLAPDDIVRVQRDGKTHEIVWAAHQPDDALLGVGVRPRDDERNENVRLDRETGKAVAIAEGRGKPIPVP
jgi:hypothetical protein